jgi:hypothetical protein
VSCVISIPVREVMSLQPWHFEEYSEALAPYTDLMNEVTAWLWFKMALHWTTHEPFGWFS